MFTALIEFGHFEMETGATASVCFVENPKGQPFSHEEMQKVARATGKDWFVVRPAEVGFDKWSAC